MKSLKYCAQKLQKAFNDWISIDQFKKRKSNKYKRKRNEFTQKLDRVFEVKTVQTPEGRTKRPHPDTLPDLRTLTLNSSSSS